MRAMAFAQVLVLIVTVCASSVHLAAGGSDVSNEDSTSNAVLLKKSSIPQCLFFAVSLRATQLASQSERHPPVSSMSVFPVNAVSNVPHYTFVFFSTEYLYNLGRVERPT